MACPHCNSEIYLYPSATSKEWNPRYLAYCKAHGFPGDPRGMLAADECTYPGGKMAGFLIWISQKWQEFDQLPQPKGYRPDVWRTKDDHDRFDSWLRR